MGDASRLVVIGGSSGGLEAAVVILQHLAPYYDLPTVLVLHQRANRLSGVPAILTARTHLQVIEPDDKQPIESGCLYIAPPNYHLLVEKERILSLSSDAPLNYSRPSIDVTFETAALAFGANLTACVLSGANQDGARGAVLIKQKGGKVIVQQPDEAQVAIMPSAAAAAVKVDAILRAKEIATVLNAFSRSGRTG